MKGMAIILLLLLCVNVAIGEDIMVPSWAVRLDREPVVPLKNVYVGDTVTFQVRRPHTVYIHPSLTCDNTDSIEVAGPLVSYPRESFESDGDGTVTYTFTEDDADYFGKMMFFACNAGTHCENGLHATFRVFPAPEPVVTMAPTQDQVENKSLEDDSPSNRSSLSSILAFFAISIGIVVAL